MVPTLSHRSMNASSGRYALDDITVPDMDEPIVSANEEIDEEKSMMIVEKGIPSVIIRSVLTCQAKRGACATCYGRNLATGKLVERGEAVGIIAAQSIGEPGTQLTMQTFHIGGAASRQVESNEIKLPENATVHFNNVRTAKNRDKKIVVVNRAGEVSAREQRRYRTAAFPGTGRLYSSCRRRRENAQGPGALRVGSL